MTTIFVLFLLSLVAFLAIQGKLDPRKGRRFDSLLRDQVGGVPFQLVSGDAQIALTEFSEEFALALTQPAVEPWASELGHFMPGRVLRLRIPIPVSAAGYSEFKGELKYRSLFEKSVELIPKTWQDGVEELASVIEAPDFIGWMTQPAAMASAAVSLPNEIMQGLLEGNGICFDNQTFFMPTTEQAIASSTNATPIVVTMAAAHGLVTGQTVSISGHVTNTAANGTFVVTVLSATTFSIPVAGNGVGGATGSFLRGGSANPGKLLHPFNVFDLAIGSFANDFVGAGGLTVPSLTNLETAKTNFRKIKAANGKPLGLRMTHVLVPPAQEEVWRDLLEQDTIIQALQLPTSQTPVANAPFGAVNNRHKGSVKLIVADELSSDTVFYPLALNKPGAHPWVVQAESAPEEIIRDKTSEFYKTTLKVSLGFVLRANGVLALPHCVQRWAGT